MFPYGGYDPFSTPSAKAYSQSQTAPDRPPYAMPAPAASMPQQYTPGFTQPFMPYMPPMMPPGVAPHPMMQGMPFNQMQGQVNSMQGQGNQNGSSMYPNNQNSGFSFGKAMGGANQLMGLAQQMGSIISLFK
jgi:hypothetical protein